MEMRMFKEEERGEFKTITYIVKLNRKFPKFFSKAYKFVHCQMEKKTGRYLKNGDIFNGDVYWFISHETSRKTREQMREIYRPLKEKKIFITNEIYWNNKKHEEEEQ